MLRIPSVCLAPQSGHRFRLCLGPLSANSGHSSELTSASLRCSVVMQRPLLKVANATLARGERETLNDRLHPTER